MADCVTLLEIITSINWSLVPEKPIWDALLLKCAAAPDRWFTFDALMSETTERVNWPSPGEILAPSPDATCYRELVEAITHMKGQWPRGAKAPSQRVRLLASYLRYGVAQETEHRTAARGLTDPVVLRQAIDLYAQILNDPDSEHDRDLVEQAKADCEEALALAERGKRLPANPSRRQATLRK